MKMTTEIPDGITTPDNIKTRIGELNLFDGVPDTDSAQKVYNLLDFNHAKVIADPAKRAANGFSRLEFTDGINILTANVWRRWQNPASNWTPYVGAGIGLSIPHVDVESAGGKTFEYQITGPAVAVVGGIKYNFNERWGMFGEYKGTYSVNKADLDNGGTLETNIVTNALNIGVAFSF